MHTLQDYDWPGNIRELENIVERALIRSTGSCLELDGGPGARALRPPAPDTGTLEAVERRHIEEVLRLCHWRINGPSNAAARLGLHPSTLRCRLQKLGISRPVNLTTN
jgi:formate hydrogenlyase transcriptional activator